MTGDAPPPGPAPVPELTDEIVRDRMHARRTFECAADRHQICAYPVKGVDCNCQCHLYQGDRKPLVRRG